MQPFFTVFSSMNNQASSSSTLLLPSPVHRYTTTRRGSLSPTSCSSIEDDPMLGYPWNNTTASPPASPTSLSNTELLNASLFNVNILKNSMDQSKEEEKDEHVPLSPESLHQSPPLPPSSGIISTSDILLDDTAGLGLPYSLFLTKEPSFYTSFDTTTHERENSTSCFSIASSTTTNNSCEEDQGMEEMDCYFSDEEENQDDDDDDEEEEEEEEFSLWPRQSTHHLSFNSFPGDCSEYGDDEKEEPLAHPLTTLLVELRKHVDTKHVLKKQEWAALCHRVKDVLIMDDHEMPEIRKCVVEYLRQLQSRYQHVPFFWQLDQQHNEESHECTEMKEQVQLSCFFQQPSSKTNDQQKNSTIEQEEVEEEMVMLPLGQRQRELSSCSVQTTSRKRSFTALKQEDEDAAWSPTPEEDATNTEDDDDDLTSLSSTSPISEPEPPTTRKQRRHRKRSSASTTHEVNKKTRKNYSRETTRILMNWYLKHGGKTPEPKHKDDLAKKAGKSHVQISTWFQNARRRHHPKLIEYQKLSKEHPTAVYDYDTFVAFNKKKSLSNAKKRRVCSDVEDNSDSEEEEENATDDDDDDDDDNSDEDYREAGSSPKRARKY